MKNQEALTPEQTATRDKIRGLFYSTKAANRALAFELARGAGCYEAMVEEFYALLGELPNFEAVLEDYHKSLKSKNEVLPEGMALLRAHIDFFADEFFTNYIDLSCRFDQREKLTYFPPVLAHMTFIVILDLSWNLLETLPDDIRQLEHLKALDLSNNKISGGLPDGLGQLTQLDTLLLKGNTEVFSTPQDGREGSNQKLNRYLFPTCLRSLKNLTHLELNDVLLDALPEWIHELQFLERLSIYGLNSRLLRLDIPDSFTQLTRLKTLKINVHAFEPPKNIDQMQSLQYLVIESARSVPSSIKNLKNLIALELNHLAPSYPIDHPQYDCLKDLYESGLLEGASRIQLYGWEWLKEMPQLIQFTFNHLAPCAFTQKEKAILKKALPNCRFILKQQ